MVGKLMKSGQEVCHFDVLLVCAGDLKFLYGVDHHDELFKGVNRESKIFLCDVQAFKVLAHVVDDFL
jgi:hypothetical protein